MVDAYVKYWIEDFRRACVSRGQISGALRTRQSLMARSTQRGIWIVFSMTFSVFLPQDAMIVVVLPGVS